MNFENWKLQRELEDSTKTNYEEIKSVTKTSFLIVALCITVMAVMEGLSYFIM
jgi:hypothetical protein